MINLTEKAVKKLKEIAEAEGVKTSVRIKVLGGGCSGFANDMFFDEVKTDLDETFEQNGIVILVDQLSYQYLGGVTIDWQDGLINSGFKFSGGNIKGSCGCGQSYEF